MDHFIPILRQQTELKEHVTQLEIAGENLWVPIIKFVTFFTGNLLVYCGVIHEDLIFHMGIYGK